MLLPEWIRLENHRPSWLFGMELDFYFPGLNLAVEFNGDQHHHYTDRFGSPRAQMTRDKRKKQICKERGIAMLSLQASDLIADVLVRKIRAALGKAGKEVAPSLPPAQALKAIIKPLNRKAAEYRAALISKFNSPTARRRGSAARKLAVACSRKLKSQTQPQL